VISVDPPGMLVFYPVPTPPNRLFLHALTQGRAALVARGSCRTQSLDGAKSTQPSSTYTVTIVVS
jgi:hypothetical protein